MLFFIDTEKFDEHLMIGIANEKGYVDSKVFNLQTERDKILSLLIKMSGDTVVVHNGYRSDLLLLRMIICGWSVENIRDEWMYFMGDKLEDLSYIKDKYKALFNFDLPFKVIDTNNLNGNQMTALKTHDHRGLSKGVVKCPKYDVGNDYRDRKWHHWDMLSADEQEQYIEYNKSDVKELMNLYKILKNCGMVK